MDLLDINDATIFDHRGMGVLDLLLNCKDNEGGITGDLRFQISDDKQHLEEVVYTLVQKEVIMEMEAGLVDDTLNYAENLDHNYFLDILGYSHGLNLLDIHPEILVIN